MASPCVRVTLCGCSLEVGTRIIAVLNIGLLAYYVFDLFFALDEYVEEANNREEGEPYASYRIDVEELKREIHIWAWVEVALLVFDFFSTIALLLVSFKKYGRRHVRITTVIWCSCTMILCFYNTSLYIFTSVRLKKTNSIARFMGLLFLVCIMMYFTVVVDSYGTEVRDRAEEGREDDEAEEMTIHRQRQKKKSLAIKYTRVHRAEAVPGMSRPTTAQEKKISKYSRQEEPGLSS